MGVITETNAEKAIEELKAYEADVATALRDSRWTVLPAAGERGLILCRKQHMLQRGRVDPALQAIIC